MPYSVEPSYTEPNNICIVGYLNWLLKITDDIANQLEDLLSARHFSQGKGWWRGILSPAFLPWDGVYSMKREKLWKFNETSYFYVDFPQKEEAFYRNLLKELHVKPVGLSEKPAWSR